MNAVEKKRLSKEAEMQVKALKKINQWKNIAVAISAIGVAITYAGMAGAERNTFLGILGIIVIVVGIVSAIVINLGLKNGRRNVEKILNVLDKGGTS